MPPRPLPRLPRQRSANNIAALPAGRLAQAAVPLACLG